METRNPSSILVRHLPITICGFIVCALALVNAQTVSNFDKERGRLMLDMVKQDLKKNYYDPTFRGMDLDARFKAADERIKTATSLGLIFGIIADALDFGDSHTFFIPPSRSYRTEYGWEMQMIGDVCYVVAVKPGSDAASKGLMLGDAIQKIDMFRPKRDNLWKLQYLYHALRPQPGMRVVAQGPVGQPRQLDVFAKVEQGQRQKDLTNFNEVVRLTMEAESASRLRRSRYWESGERDLIIWKLPEFESSLFNVDDFMSKVKKRRFLILDLRGNPGGEEAMMLRLIGSLLNHDVKVGEIKSRKETKALVAKSRGDKAFDGKLIVLVDSLSASASEILARVIQLEKRGTVLGDLSAGAVMRSRFYPHEAGTDIVAFYGASITDADLIMADGKSLEHVGVTPDELLLPTAADLAAKRDPVLARAAALAGVKLDPEQAGSLFPIEWRK